MAIKLSTLLSRTRTLEIEVSEEASISVVYSMGKYTPEFLDRTIEESKTHAEMISELLVSWDVTDDNGDALGVDLESVKQIPMSILRTIFQAIASDQLPNRKRDDSSDSG